MIKKIIVKIYTRAVFKYRILNFFTLPNFFSKVRFKIDSSAHFEQKTLLTGEGTINIGKDCLFGYKLGGFNKGAGIEFQARSTESIIFIDERVCTNNNVFISSVNKIYIGADTLIGQNVCIMDYEAHGIEPTKRKTIGEVGEVKINENVWIGNNVIILKDTEIGKNSIVAAGAIVKGYFPENVIIGGIPAKVIKKI